MCTPRDHMCTPRGSHCTPVGVCKAHVGGAHDQSIHWKGGGGGAGLIEICT